MCDWQEDFNTDIQSAVAVQGDRWVGFETVESSRPKLQYVLDNELAGTMWWAMDLDDYTGRACGLGKYPLIKGVKNLLAHMQTQQTTTQPVTSTTTVTTTQMTSTTPSLTHCRDPDIEFANSQSVDSRDNDCTNWKGGRYCYISCQDGFTQAKISNIKLELSRG